MSTQWNRRRRHEKQLKERTSQHWMYTEWGTYKLCGINSSTKNDAAIVVTPITTCGKWARV